jgi:hypothetical protein
VSFVGVWSVRTTFHVGRCYFYIGPLDGLFLRLVLLLRLLLLQLDRLVHLWLLLWGHLPSDPSVPLALRALVNPVAGLVAEWGKLSGKGRLFAAIFARHYITRRHVERPSGHGKPPGALNVPVLIQNGPVALIKKGPVHMETDQSGLFRPLVAGFEISSGLL